ncbi:helix-turn-helix domain-containing protein [Ralstonia solanacearum]
MSGLSIIGAESTRFGPRSRQPLISRFARYVQVSPGGCWLWTGAKNACGYGVLGRGRRSEGLIRAHRLAYQLFHGIVLERSQHVLHRCDTRVCVNPEHLFIGTQQDNMCDMRSKGRAVPPPRHVGIANHKAKLDEHKVRQIFAMRRAGNTKYQIAQRMGVSRATVYSILNRFTWRHVDVADYLC